MTRKIIAVGLKLLNKEPLLLTTVNDIFTKYICSIVRYMKYESEVDGNTLITQDGFSCNKLVTLNTTLGLQVKFITMVD